MRAKASKVYLLIIGWTNESRADSRGVGESVQESTRTASVAVVEYSIWIARNRDVADIWECQGNGSTDYKY